MKKVAELRQVDFGVAEARHGAVVMIMILGGRVRMGGRTRGRDEGRVAGGNLVETIAAGRFGHRWLSDEFVVESLRLGAEEQSKEHHYRPQMYLKRWTVGGRVQSVLVDRRQVLPPQRPKEVAKKTNFYSLPAADSTMDQPLRWIEKHLSRIEVIVPGGWISSSGGVLG